MALSEVMLDSTLKEGIEIMNKCLSYCLPYEDVEEIKKHRRKMELLYKARSISMNYRVFSALSEEYKKRGDWTTVASFRHQMLNYEKELEDIESELEKIREETECK